MRRLDAGCCVARLLGFSRLLMFVSEILSLTTEDPGNGFRDRGFMERSFRGPSVPDVELAHRDTWKCHFLTGKDVYLSSSVAPG
jgi:hypothetical protein